MVLIPHKRETLVLPFDAREVEELLILYVKPVNDIGAPPIQKEAGDFLFNGWIQKGRFRISRIISIPQNFLPLINGYIEPTSLGCILFLHYRLFGSTILFMSLWIGISLLMSVLFIFVLNQLFYGLLAIFSAALCYIIAVNNFNLQLNRSRAALENLFELLKNRS